jgi:hypothetical protein
MKQLGGVKRTTEILRRWETGHEYIYQGSTKSVSQQSRNRAPSEGQEKTSLALVVHSAMATGQWAKRLAIYLLIQCSASSRSFRSAVCAGLLMKVFRA